MNKQVKLSDLHIKILPPGADRVLDVLEKNSERIECIDFIIEKVPLLIMGRHGMIVRFFSVNGTQKYSQPAEIAAALIDFFKQDEKLYLFVNLPDLPIPAHVNELIDEIAIKVDLATQFRHHIDEALDARDHNEFLYWSEELKKLEAQDSPTQACGS